MGFVGYRVGLEFVHKGVVAESENFVSWRHVGFLEKGRSMDWVWQTHFFHVVDGGLRIEAAPQHEGVPQMEFVLRWEDALQH
jgi:hypothetical protein